MSVASSMKIYRFPFYALFLVLNLGCSSIDESTLRQNRQDIELLFNQKLADTPYFKYCSYYNGNTLNIYFEDSILLNTELANEVVEKIERLVEHSPPLTSKFAGPVYKRFEISIRTAIGNSMALSEILITDNDTQTIHNLSQLQEMALRATTRRSTPSRTSVPTKIKENGSRKRRELAQYLTRGMEGEAIITASGRNYTILRYETIIMTKDYAYLIYKNQKTRFEELGFEKIEFSDGIGFFISYKLSPK